MNSLILCHLIWSDLTLSSQLELPPIQSLLLIIFFPIISQEIISGNLRQPYQITYENFLLHPTFFSNAPNEKSNIFERDCLNSILKSLF